MTTKKDGHTLIELMIVMAIFTVVLAIVSDTFKTIIRQSFKQSAITGTQMETNIGLQMLRTDIEHAGMGLPWALSVSSMKNFSEVTAGKPVGFAHDATIFNDSASNVPRALLAGDGFGLNGSDYLVIKSVGGALNNASQHWSYVLPGAVNLRVWGGADDLAGSDRVVVIRQSFGESGSRQLVMAVDGAFSATSAAVLGALPVQAGDIVYGVDNTALARPFNRTDYYVRQPATMPTSCAPNTGILYKATVNHADGNFTEYPILDCIADMRIVLGFDMNRDGTVDTYATGLDSGGTVNNVSSTIGASAASVQAALGNPAQLRTQLKEVRIFILAHEGQRDPEYFYPNQNVILGGACKNDSTKSCSIDADCGGKGPCDVSGLGKGDSLNTLIGANWRNYRWKVYTLVVKPGNL